VTHGGDQTGAPTRFIRPFPDFTILSRARHTVLFAFLHAGLAPTISTRSGNPLAESGDRAGTTTQQAFNTRQAGVSTAEVMTPNRHPPLFVRSSWFALLVTALPGAFGRIFCYFVPISLSSNYTAFSTAFDRSRPTFLSSTSLNSSRVLSPTTSVIDWRHGPSPIENSSVCLLRHCNPSSKPH
jgi:hypothetical protein